MSAFGDGFTLGFVSYGESYIFHFEIAYNQLGHRYKWETARLQLVGSEIPARVASRADLLKIAAYLDNAYGFGALGSRNSASKQLGSYLAILDTVGLPIEKAA